MFILKTKHEQEKPFLGLLNLGYSCENHRIKVMSINLNQDWCDFNNDLLEMISVTNG